MALSTQELDQLETILFSEPVADESLDYFGVHGLLCAAIVGPVEMKQDQIVQLVFSGTQEALSPEQLEHFNKCIKDIDLDIRTALQEGTPVSLPHEDEEEYESALESWCAGFMEGFFAHETKWFSRGEEVAAELLLPIMTLSGLFDSEEFNQIRSSDRLMAQFESILGDQLTDIYLFYHSE